MLRLIPGQNENTNLKNEPERPTSNGSQDFHDHYTKIIKSLRQVNKRQEKELRKRAD